MKLTGKLMQSPGILSVENIKFSADIKEQKKRHG
jgi:hypothetical protein